MVPHSSVELYYLQAFRLQSTRRADWWRRGQGFHSTNNALSWIAAQHSAAQHSTAQHSTAQHSAAQRSTAQHSAAQHSTAQHSAAQRSTTQHSTAQHSTAQRSAAQPSTAQHSTAQHSAAQRSTAQHRAPASLVPDLTQFWDYPAMRNRSQQLCAQDSLCPMAMAVLEWLS
ncbi:UNVERIFIED_CONTAM: hypothetical protein FKN15_011521 [Acipenser sinensis]